jgi:hypothetical protein
MIETSLIQDRTHYQKEQLEIMRSALMRNFILFDNPELETGIKHTAPETRIYIKLVMGLLPDILFRALGEDLCYSIGGSFLNTFVNPNSSETPTLIFHFVGDFRSFEFKIKSRDEKMLEEASGKVIDKLVSLLKTEELPAESDNTHIFQYENEDWTQVK